MSKNLLKIFLTISTIYIIETAKSKKVFKFSEKDFDEEVLRNKNDKKKWIFVLYSPKYNTYKGLSELIKNEVMPFTEDDSNINFGLINLESPEVPWLEKRLSVSYVPSLLYMENGLMYPLKTSPEFSEDTIINLLEKEKNPSKFKPIPPQFTLIQKTKMIYINVMDDLNLNIQEFFDNRDINITWTYTKSWLTFFSFAALVLVPEYIILKRYYKNQAIKQYQQMKMNAQKKQAAVNEKKENNTEEKKENEDNKNEKKENIKNQKKKAKKE